MYICTPFLVYDIISPTILLRGKALLHTTSRTACITNSVLTFSLKSVHCIMQSYS